jgi:hypothetical protein
MPQPCRGIAGFDEGSSGSDHDGQMQGGQKHDGTSTIFLLAVSQRIPAVPDARHSSAAPLYSTKAL